MALRIACCLLGIDEIQGPALARLCNLEISQKPRARFYIIAETLAMAKNETSKTRINYRANLSFAQPNEYLSLLLERELPRVNAIDGKTVYRITGKGVEYGKDTKRFQAS